MQHNLIAFIILAIVIAMLVRVFRKNSAAAPVKISWDEVESSSWDTADSLTASGSIVDSSRNQRQQG